MDNHPHPPPLLGSVPTEPGFYFAWSEGWDWDAVEVVGPRRESGDRGWGSAWWGDVAVGELYVEGDDDMPCSLREWTAWSVRLAPPPPPR